MTKRRAAAVLAACAAAGVAVAAAPAGAAGNAAGGAAGGAATLALDQSPEASLTPAAASTTQPPDGALVWRLLHRALHGQLVVTDGAAGTTETVDVQRGTVTAISATSVTIRSPDAFTQTYVINGQTKLRTGHGTNSAVSDISAGDKAAVLAFQDGSTHVAKRLLTRPPG